MKDPYLLLNENKGDQRKTEKLFFSNKSSIKKSISKSQSHSSNENSPVFLSRKGVNSADFNQANSHANKTVNIINFDVSFEGKSERKFRSQTRKKITMKNIEKYYQFCTNRAQFACHSAGNARNEPTRKMRFFHIQKLENHHSQMFTNRSKGPKYSVGFNQCVLAVSPLEIENLGAFQQKNKIKTARIAAAQRSENAAQRSEKTSPSPKCLKKKQQTAARPVSSHWKTRPKALQFKRYEISQANTKLPEYLEQFKLDAWEASEPPSLFDI